MITYHHQTDSCINLGSDESHFNVSIILRNKVTRLRRILSWYFTSTETIWLIREGGRMGWEMRAQAHLLFTQLLNSLKTESTDHNF